MKTATGDRKSENWYELAYAFTIKESGANKKAVFNGRSDFCSASDSEAESRARVIAKRLFAKMRDAVIGKFVLIRRERPSDIANGSAPKTTIKEFRILLIDA